MQDVLVLIGVLFLFVAIGCQIWLILLLMRGNPILGFVALIIPFFTWYFAIQNWDLAKWPFIIHVGSIIAWLTLCWIGTVL